MKVNEIFYSLQGEGLHTGRPAVFLRLSGCNTRCPFCDTQHESGTEMSEDDIMKLLLRYPTRHVVITGGEPTMQITPELTQTLHSNGYYIQIETNGSLPLPEGCDIDWITCSPKELQLRIQRIDELKVLFDISRSDNEQRIERLSNVNAKEYRLQPLDSGNEEQNRENLKATTNYILQHPKWTLSLQTHKILGME